MAHLARREIARDFLYLSTVRAASLAVGLVRSFFIPRFLGPMVYGMWKTLGIVQSYSQFADLGALAALKRQIPFHQQRGDEERLRESRDIAFFVNHVALFLVALCLVAASFFVPEPLFRRSLRTYVLLLYVIQIHGFMEQFLYWRKQFAEASRINLVLALVEALLAITGSWLYGLDGLIVFTLVGYAGAIFFQLRAVAFEIGFRFRWSHYVELVKIGFPSHVNGLLYNLLMSVDRLLILPYLGLKELGLYALGMTLNDYLFQFAYALGNAISPRLVERYSASESIVALRPMVEKSTLAISVATPAVLGAVFFAAPAAIEVALPNFRGAIGPLRILLVGTYFSSLHRGLSSFFLAIRKQARLFPAYGGAILLNLGLVWAGLHSGMGISGVAACTSTTFAIFSLTLIVMARHFFVKRLSEHLGFIGLLLSPLAWGCLSVWAGSAFARWVLPGGHPLARAAIEVAAFGAAYSPLFLAGYLRLRPS